MLFDGITLIGQAGCKGCSIQATSHHLCEVCSYLLSWVPIATVRDNLSGCVCIHYILYINPIYNSNSDNNNNNDGSRHKPWAIVHLLWLQAMRYLPLNRHAHHTFHLALSQVNTLYPPKCILHPSSTPQSPIVYAKRGSGNESTCLQCLFVC
jgi:hypothetical protein